MWYQRFSTGESVLSGTKPNQLKRRDPPSTTILSPAGKGGVTVSMICLCVSHSPALPYFFLSRVATERKCARGDRLHPEVRRKGTSPIRVNREREQEQPQLSSTPPLHPLACPGPLQFCVVLIEKQSAEGTRSCLVVVFSSHRLEKALTSRDPSLVVAR